jgi:hypothetical protein
LVVKRQTNLASGFFSARATHLLVLVRGGSHHIPGSCVCNGGRVMPDQDEERSEGMMSGGNVS